VRLAAVVVALVAAIPARALGTPTEADAPAAVTVPPSTAPPAVEQKTAAPEERWYGAPALLAEGGALGLVIAGGVMTNQPGTSRENGRLDRLLS
jgi:hypothetical protein